MEAITAATVTITTTTITVIVKENESSCYKIETVHIKQFKIIFENWHCECTKTSIIDGNGIY